MPEKEIPLFTQLLYSNPVFVDVLKGYRSDVKCCQCFPETVHLKRERT